LSARGAAVGAERKVSNQLATEFGAEVTVGGVVVKELFDLGAESVDEFFHLLAVFTLPGSVDKTVEAVDKFPVSPIGLSVSNLVTAFPAQRTHNSSSSTG